MDKHKQNLKGSKKLDEFKYWHKKLDRQFYATDGDLCLISKLPPGTVAYLDYKGSGEDVTFAEAIQYNEWMQHAPVFIVESYTPARGPFRIRRYLGANWRPEPPDVNWGDEITVADWDSFSEWERKLRETYKRLGGWEGKLRKK